ncbi:hypothetical protein EV1_034574 [Malus domestica]
MQAEGQEPIRARVTGQNKPSGAGCAWPRKKAGKFAMAPLQVVVHGSKITAKAVGVIANHKFGRRVRNSQRSKTLDSSIEISKKKSTVNKKKLVGGIRAWLQAMLVDDFMGGDTF